MRGAFRNGERPWRGSWSRGHYSSSMGRPRPDFANEGENNWDEERMLQLKLEQQVVRKLSMRRWIQERHKFWPSRPATEKLKVEEMEMRREIIYKKEGWPLPYETSLYEKGKKTKWEQLANKKTIAEVQGTYQHL